MRKRYKGMVQAAAAAAVLALAPGFPGEALGATKPISSVSVRVDSNLEAGQKLPEIQIGNTSVSDREVGVKAGNSRYRLTEAEWAESSSEAVEVADEPRMEVTLEPEDVSEAYFLASYKSSDVSISGGSFVSARRKGNSLTVTLRVDGVKGDFTPPEDVWWEEDSLGTAQWSQADLDSGYYQVELLRDEKRVFQIDRTTSKSYNFYPYMTEQGDYVCRVRTIPGTDRQKKYGDESDWVESGELNISDLYVSDGKGRGDSARPGTMGQAGWSNTDGVWRWSDPDGNLARGGWRLLDGQWYYFDMDGTMLTGWRQIGGFWYYLHENGQMAVGWNRLDGRWYYFLPQAEGNSPQGSMAAPGWRVIGPYYYFFNQDGSMYTGWLFQDNHWYYLNSLDNSAQGIMMTGWFERDGLRYFANPRGEMAEGWWYINGSWYYFYPGSGYMARDTRIDGFYVGEDGSWSPEGS